MLSIFSEYLKCYLLFICVFVCVLCMHTRKYQWDPEENVKFPGAGVQVAISGVVRALKTKLCPLPQQ